MESGRQYRTRRKISRSADFQRCSLDSAFPRRPQAAGSKHPYHDLKANVIAGAEITLELTTQALKLAFNLPQFMDYESILERALLADRLGYHSIWLQDHLWQLRLLEAGPS
jgi:hypothetical protein